ncbi:helicase-exonuclease AddAB subunit AddA [Fusibacillus kribbianus]|uniref:ATP-dependent helicase/nuclease subunit A n=1 Tax=Fusibacillus kribbianus TaxID=3044208 RepID=A0AAP4F050_9FIRM|nr:helicase-exonuclease AddAB subunit AddA [Ruminococcus sp. YH-rum2234]MDI9242800.1 helicase-exonuclease AddAB subunit AddA [Ruminococcus sp. YH-rum2234]
MSKVAVEWTEEQKKIIGLRDRNILVAAAAGSGKTAVLVERIMAIITDEMHPVDIDRLLVVTFTNAAAAQMRERIGARLEQCRSEEPDNQNLKRQEDLLPHARIMTIDSFCLYVVRNYFSFLDLDPDFRIGDEGELKLIREDVMKELLEEKYAEASPEFLLFVESYAEGKGDGSIAEYIDRLYQFASAYPEPEVQLALWREQLCPASAEELDASLFMRCLMEELKLRAGELKEQYEEAKGLCMESPGLEPYETMFDSDERIVLGLLAASGYEEAASVLKTVGSSFMTKPRISKKLPVDEEAKEFLGALRDAMKKEVKELADGYYLGELPRIYSDICAMGRTLTELTHLAEEYGRAYSAAKREKNLVDFNDVAHFALKILTEKSEDGTEFVPSETAKEMSGSFYEIMIDEYQDSNRIQEAILNSVSGERTGRPNVFMVGDVKQSIYKFRQAVPELFMEKYASYTRSDSAHQKIDLHRNFRSRENVLSAANFLFEQLMDEKLGGISYDENAALIPGRQFPQDPDGREASGREKGNNGPEMELILIDSGKENDDEELKELEAKELEARAVAKRIRELCDPEEGLRILDGTTGEYRTARYGDIVILLRTVSEWAEVFTNCLMEEGIPAVSQSRTGYFSAREIRCILDLLRIIDNPMQDIPLAAVMRSPIGGFTSEEMAILAAKAGQAVGEEGFRGLYGALLYCRRETVKLPEKLAVRIEEFLALLSDFRERAVYMRLHQLLRYILEKTGYGCVIAAMPGGAIRKKNMEMLIKRAIDYENTSYQGVFQFVRYIERLQKYSVDFGEASQEIAGENTVRITSIHKSKGLEYPIVILAGAGKPFNQKDTNRKILMHPELGLAADYVDVENRVKAATLPKRVLQRRLRLDNLGEELRVLYVALTRAEEKLIVTGSDRHLESRLMKWNSLRLKKERRLPFRAVASASSYLDWILMALIRNRAYGELLSERGITPPVLHSLYGEPVPIVIRMETVEALVHHETIKQASDQYLKENLLWRKGKAEGNDLAKGFRRELAYRYPFEAAVSAPRVFSVSQLKEEAASELFEKLEFEEPSEEKNLPGFLKDTEPLSGAARGTAYHRLLELLPFTAGPEEEELKKAVRDLEGQGILPAGTEETVDLGKISRFLASPLGRRMADADRRGSLKKEQQFVMGLPAARIRPEYGDPSLEGELMLVQGIIDVWFAEEDGLVLVDYKTDRITGPEAEQTLVERYRTQLDYYRCALEMSTGKKVKERYLYSFCLGKAIPV